MSKKVLQMSSQQRAVSTALKVGDTVMVIAGGNKHKRPNVGKIGKITSFTGFGRDRVIVEGVNMVTKHKRQTNPQDKAAKITIPASIHISNVMFYAEKIAKPVRLKVQSLKDGKKARGYVNPEDKKFIEV